MSGPPIPDALARAAGELARAGHRSWVVGAGVPDWLAGGPPGSLALWTEACFSALLEALPRAVAVDPAAGRALAPGPGGADVVSCRRPDPPRGDLAHRAFTRDAVAVEAATGECLDPFGGRADAAARRLRSVGDSRERLEEAPLRALRAARRVAEHDLRCDPDLQSALAETGPALERLPVHGKRRELRGLLSAPHPGRGIGLLRRTGLEASLMGPAREDCEAVLEALGRPGLGNASLRLAVWLRDLDAPRLLARLAWGEPGSSAVLRWLSHHPLDRSLVGPPERALSRLERRLGRDGVDLHFAVVEAELAVRPDPDRARRLALLRDARGRGERERHRAAIRGRLALDGAAVMRILGIGAGPEVGRALAALVGHVEAHPEDNRAETLERWLRRRRTEEPW